MLELRGAPALSAFRHARLLAVLRERVPEVEALSADYVHFIDHHQDALDAADRERLAQLLDYGHEEAVEPPKGAQRFGGAAHRYPVTLVVQGNGYCP